MVLMYNTKDIEQSIYYNKLNTSEIIFVKNNLK